MSMVALFGAATTFFTEQQSADAKVNSSIYDGPYLWEGVEYESFVRKPQSGGYIDEYTNKDTYCHSWIFHPGLSLLPDAALGICYLLFLFWLFMGIAILADLFMEAIEKVTSKCELRPMVDLDGNIINVEVMFWNPTIANLTLMALGSSAPEIILSIADTMGTLGDIPSELGPQAIVGSAAFNLLVISAVSIVAVEEPKKIKMVRVFLTTAVFSTWAYIWFFMTLVVISPGVVELWEAALTLGFMLILVILAYSCDKCHSKGDDENEKRAHERRMATKAAIRVLAKKFGTRTLLEIGQGERDPQKAVDAPALHEADKDMILEYFSILLTDES